MIPKHLKIMSIAMVGIALLSSLYLVSGINSETPNSEITENESKLIARNFVENSPTYQFDGNNLKHVETLYPEIVDCTNCWTFVFGFESTHAGYGDRTGKMLAQVITPHEAHVTVENGEVSSANLDQKWNMLSQTPIEN